MKKLLIPSMLSIAILLVSCSGGGNTPVTAAERDQALAAMSSAQGSGLAAAQASGDPADSIVSYVGPNFSLTVTFAPDLGGFLSAPTSSATFTETITDYYEASSGYTISGTLTCTISCTGASVDSITYSGVFTLSGGKVQTMSVDMAIDYTDFTYTGSVTVNGQTFAY